jgi:hypothetical protein
MVVGAIIGKKVQMTSDSTEPAQGFDWGQIKTDVGYTLLSGQAMIVLRLRNQSHVDIRINAFDYLVSGVFELTSGNWVNDRNFPTGGLAGPKRAELVTIEKYSEFTRVIPLRLLTPIYVDPIDGPGKSVAWKYLLHLVGLTGLAEFGGQVWIPGMAFVQGQ